MPLRITRRDEQADAEREVDGDDHPLVRGVHRRMCPAKAARPEIEHERQEQREERAGGDHDDPQVEEPGLGLHPVNHSNVPRRCNRIERPSGRCEDRGRCPSTLTSPCTSSTSNRSSPTGASSAYAWRAHSFCVRSIRRSARRRVERVTGLSRLGKRIVLRLEDASFLVLHLMIAGRLRWRPARSQDRRQGRPGGVRLRNRYAARHRGELQEARLAPLRARRGRPCARTIPAVSRS